MVDLFVEVVMILLFTVDDVVMNIRYKVHRFFSKFNIINDLEVEDAWL